MSSRRVTWTICLPLLLAAVGGMAACTAGDDADAPTGGATTSVPEVSSSTTPDAAPATPTATPAALPLGGDCTAVLGAADADAVLGAATPAAATGVDDALACAWQGDAGVLTVTAYADVAGADVDVDRYAGVVCEDGACMVGVEGSVAWALVSLAAPGGAGFEEPPAQLAMAADLVRGALAG